MVRLHRFVLSGHCHRVELFLSLIGRPVEAVEVDLVNGATRSPAFLRLNPFGQVPVIEDGDVVLADSNAILVYLARKYDPSWYPADPLRAAEVQRWLSVAAGPLAHGPAAARLAVLFGFPEDPKTHEVAGRLFEVVEGTVAAAPYLTGDSATVADIAMYTYTAHAPEGGIALEPYPAIRRWLARIEGLPGFVPMARA